jgi:intraflagellar transport protein 172
VGVCASNKCFTLYEEPTGAAVTLAPAPNGEALIAGHSSGILYRYTFPNQATRTRASRAQIASFDYSPEAVAWGESIVVAGATKKVTFMTNQGAIVQEIDFSGETSIADFTTARFNSTGQTVVLANTDRCVVFSWDSNRRSWKEAPAIEAKNLYTITALDWKPDGSQITTGSLCGSVDTFDACMRRYVYRNKYEFTYTSPSAVLIKVLPDAAAHDAELAALPDTMISSKYGAEITKLNIYSDRFVVAKTAESLIAGDMLDQNITELPWSSQGTEKFYFDNPHVCLVFNAGELTLLEYGKEEPLGSCRTEYMSPHLISVQITEFGYNAADSDAKSPADTYFNSLQQNRVTKKIAYLLDSQAIRIMDLQSGATEATVNHDCKIDWLELNYSGSKLLFRDKLHHLHVYDIEQQQRTTLLNFCNYVQWVPDSDVCIAQNRGNLCVWYSIDNPDQVTLIPIKGDVLEIERADGKTEVLIDQRAGTDLSAAANGPATARVPLNESLIAFGAAMDTEDFVHALQILEALPSNAKGAQGMWRRLCTHAMQRNMFVVAERCCSALGDVSKARYLRSVNASAKKSGGSGRNDYEVRAKMAILQKQFKRAEATYLEQGQIDKAIDMYCRLHKWSDALAVATARRHPQLNELKQQYFEYLMSTQQECEAGRLKEKEGDVHTALQLYLRGGYPTQASKLILSHRLTHDTSLVEQVVGALMEKKLCESAGQFLEQLGQPERAMDAYRTGNVFRRAVELSRRHFPERVVELEAEWGDFCASRSQMDLACNHYLEAHAYIKAINAAIEARQWSRVKDVLNHLDPKEGKPYYLRIAKHYEDSKQFDVAERYYIQGDLPHDAVTMYNSLGKWEKGRTIAMTYMSEEDVYMLYRTQAQDMEAAGRFADAEKLYVLITEPDLAINMYKKTQRYDDMVRLVAAYRADLLNRTYQHLADQLQKEGKLRDAEKYCAKIKDWKGAVKMYSDKKMWDDALRVAKAIGGPAAFKHVAYLYALSVLGGDAGVAFLDKNNLLDECIDYAIDRKEFSEAFYLCENGRPGRTTDAHYRFAMALEDEGQYEKAEEEFIAGEKPREAIGMYVHQRAWIPAMRIAQDHCPESVPDVFEAQARAFETDGAFEQAENMYIQAKKPELAVEMYKNDGNWDEAIRCAKMYVPELVQSLSVMRNHQSSAPGHGTGNGAAATSGSNAFKSHVQENSAEFLQDRARKQVQRGEYSHAIDTYLQINEEHCPNDPDALQAYWEEALAIAMDRVHARINEVAKLVTSRLVNLNCHAAAADMWLTISAPRLAIDACLSGQLFEKAEEIVHEHAPQLASYVRAAHEKHLIENRNVDGLVGVNNIAAIELHANQGNWDTVYKIAKEEGEYVVRKFAAIHSKSLGQEGRWLEALKILRKYGVTAAPENFALYQRLTRELLHRDSKELFEAGALDAADYDGQDDVKSSNSADAPLNPRTVFSTLRQLLFDIVSELKDSLRTKGNNAPSSLQNAAAEFETLLNITHYVSIKETAGAKQGTEGMLAKCAVSLLRHAKELPFDKVFYEAGIACRTAEWQNMAFVLLNRFVDITEWIDDPDSHLENEDFLETDIPTPYDVRLPTKQRYDEMEREDAKEWVITTNLSMTSDEAQKLAQRKCEKCNQPTYVASLECHKCHVHSEPCIVTGFPVLRDERVVCKHCSRAANRRDWNSYVTLVKKECAWCHAPAKPVY